MTYYVYRFLDKQNEVIYVGRTNNLKTRMNQHFNPNKKENVERNNEICKIDYIELQRKIHSYIYEIQLIDYYKPKYNKDFLFEEISEVLVQLGDLKFIDLDKKTIDELKNRKPKTIRYEKFSGIKKYNRDTMEYYIAKYGFTENESFMMLEILENCYGQYFEAESLKNEKYSISLYSAKKFIDKLLENKFIYLNEEITNYKGTENYTLLEKFICPNFEL